MEAIEEQSLTHPFNVQSDHKDIQTAGSEMDHEHSCHLQTDSSLITIPTILPSERCDVLAGESTFATDSEAGTTIYPGEPPLLRARTASPAIDQLDSRETGTSECLNHEHDAGAAHLTDEEGTLEDFDHSCDDFPSSLPPSSSPPQFLSSSPYASSQSSVSGTELPKMPQGIETGDCASSHDWPHSGDVVPVLEEEFNLESEDPPNSATATSPETDVHRFQMSPVSHNENDLGQSRKRSAFQSDSEEPCRFSPNKHPKSDSCLYLPPAPKRATLVSHHRQFKKLAAPFRPPSKLPVVPGGPAQTINSREAESTTNATPHSDHEKIDSRSCNTRLHLRNKASNMSGSVTQFKSPLLNKAHSAESRTIRLTPALQALERKLQLLKRAIKVKEDGEEEILVRLTGKWIEAGREVAYDVWDATKDASDFEGKGKVTSTHKSYGWESSNNGNTSWGWDTKPEVNEESCGPDSSVAAVRSVLEEVEEVCHNTLGTMLRQLGIASEILGWDDDKETFSD